MDDRRPVNDCFALPPGVDWTPVADALAALRGSVSPVAAVEETSLWDAAGRWLAADAVAVADHPAATNAAVDGYAFAHTDYLAEPLTVAEGRAAAGAPFGRALRSGEAVRILTGAPLPTGADTVMLDEDARLDGGRLYGPTGLRAGVNRRNAGENIAVGDVVLNAGDRLTPQALAQAASAGLGRLSVRKRLKVAVLSTGDEIAAPGEPLGPGGVYDANGPMLAGLLRNWGFEPVILSPAADDAGVVRAALDEAAAGAQAILASGGASAGDEDHMARLLGEEGSRAVWRIAMKPGRPLALGRWRGVPVFGLPGNPVAAFVCALIFARPALTVLAGGPWAEAPVEMRPARFTKRRKPGRDEFLRARSAPDGGVEVFANEGSGLIRGLLWADGLVHLPDGGPDVDEGDMVRFLPFAGFGA